MCMNSGQSVLVSFLCRNMSLLEVPLSSGWETERELGAEPVAQMADAPCPYS